VRDGTIRVAFEVVDVRRTSEAIDARLKSPDALQLTLFGPVDGGG
jgi:hypothetical protein